MAKDYIMGLDIGTTSTKAVIFNKNGEQIARQSAHYPLYTDIYGKAEQDPNEIFIAIVKAVSTLMAEGLIELEDLRAISFSSAMHSLILFDEKNQPLTNCITWADERSSHVLEQLKQQFDLHELYKKTGTPIHQMSPFAKICWLNQERPELMAKTKRIAGIKSYVLYRLFGKWLIDESLASGSGLYSLKKQDWEEEALKIARITPDKLPEVVAETDQLTNLNKNHAAMLGILPETIFVVGASDGALANLGIQATGENEVTVTVGTSGAVRKVASNYQIDENGRTFCYRITKNKYIVGGAVNNGGKIIEWALSEFGTEMDRLKQNYEHFVSTAQKVKPGAEGLIFQPYLLGERAPLWTNRIRGAFVGITINHTNEHFIRAILEGVALNLATVYEGFKGKEDILYVTGNMATLSFWCQLLANVFDREVRVPHIVESSSLGAAIIGMTTLKIISDFKLSKKPTISKTYYPEPEIASAYRELLEIYQSITQRLLSSYGELIDWNHKFTK